MIQISSRCLIHSNTIEIEADTWSKKGLQVECDKYRGNMGWGLFYILRATNWWNTSKMFGSRSCVKSNVSSVELYLSTCEGKIWDEGYVVFGPQIKSNPKSEMLGSIGSTCLGKPKCHLIVLQQRHPRFPNICKTSKRSSKSARSRKGPAKG